MDKQRSVFSAEHTDWQGLAASRRAVREYLATLEQAAWSAASEVVPKFVSRSDPAAQWTGAHKGHAFPMAGTLMIEPTESESKVELDRFCDAMIAIRAEIRDIETGRMSKNDNPLKNAPHTALDLADDNWRHPYPRMLGCYPAGASGDKYWCPVNRVDNVYGDRHVVCIRQPMESYSEAAK